MILPRCHHPHLKVSELSDMLTKLLPLTMTDPTACTDYYPIQRVYLMRSIPQHAQGRKRFERHVPDLARKQQNSEIFLLSLRCTEFCEYPCLFLERWRQPIPTTQRWFAFQCAEHCHFLSNIVKNKQRLKQSKNLLVITTANWFPAWAWTDSWISNSNGLENVFSAQGTSPQT